LARSTDLKSSRLLIPLSFASILGGTCTLTGTSTNLVIDGQAQALGLQPFTMFELTPLGLVYAAIGFVYMLTIGRKLLPSRESPGMNTIEAKKRHFLTQVMIQEDSPLVGKTLTDTLIKTFPEARILEIRRQGVVQTTPLNELTLEAFDRIRLTVHGASFEDFKQTGGVAFSGGKELKLSELENETLKLMEGIVGPRSRLDGKTLKELNFRQRFGVIILAVHRKGVDLRKKMEDVRLRSGDTLIVEGRVDSINRLQEEMDFVSITEPPKREVRPGKGKIAALITIAFIMGATFKTYPIAMLAILAAGLLLLTRCLEPREAYRSVQWNIIFLLFGMLALGKAMETSGGAETIAVTVERIFGNSSPVVILAVIYLLSSILTELISNTAVAALITPIVIKIAANIDVDPRPFVVAIMFGCSASFATPIGYQTNTYVYGAGGYKFTDFPKVGVPLNLILWLVATMLIPVFWPFKKDAATAAPEAPAPVVAPAQ
ncbi:MAG: SLC13 family permease, partial [Verrucomicrobiota bacterium]